MKNYNLLNFIHYANINYLNFIFLNFKENK